MLDRSIRSSWRGFWRRSSLADARHCAVELAALALSLSTLATGCAPEVGSERWCAQMKETAKADWSANEAVDFAKLCLFD